MYYIADSNIRKVLPLFREAHLKLVRGALAVGNQPSRIWADNSETPHTAFMWDKSHCFYLVGDEKNDDFNEAVSTLISESLAPEAVEKGFSIFKVYHTKGWEHFIHHVFGRSLLKRERQLYTFDRLKIDWRSEVISGSSVKCIEESLLKETLKNTEYVIEEIESMWGSLTRFFENGFGFLTIYDDEIVCWCTAEYVGNGMCGIGIETIQEFQNRGFATVTASAFAEFCISRNVVPHWDSWSDNVPSIRVAEKVGFEKTIDFTAYIGSFKG